MFLILTCLAVVSNIYLGLAVFLKNPKSATGRMFLILTTILVLWSVTNYFSLYFTNPGEILFWIRAVMIVTGAMFPAIYLLTTAFPSNNLNVSNFKIGAIVAFILLTQILATTNLVFQEVIVTNGSANPVPGPAIAIVAINFLGFLLLTLITLYRKNKVATGLAKTQLRYLSYGIALTFIFGVITNFIFVVFLKNTFFVSLGPLFSLILVGFTAYAIIKHRLMDIRSVVARSVSYVMLVLVAGAFYASGLFFVGTYIVKQPTTSTNLVTSTILAMIIAFTFQSFLRFIEKITDHIFYKDHYDSNTLLGKLGRIMASTIRLDVLTRATLHEVISAMRVSRGVFLIFHNQNIYPPIAEGYDKEPSFNLSDLKIFYESKRLFIFQEEEDENVKQFMRQLDIEVVLPLYIGDKTHGLLILGNKQSGEIYSGQDIEVLQIFGPEVSVAVQNSKAYEEIKKFNITLGEEIGKATGDLKVANTKLEQLDRLKDDFVSIASHELRTPMTAIKSYLWMALYKGDVKLTEKMGRYLNRAYISTERLINLVNDMLNVSRIESGRIEIAPKAFEMPNLINDVLEEVKPKADERQVKLEAGQTRVPQVFADPDKVHQVLLNLVGNALKFTPQDGLIKIDFFTDGQVVEVSVKDNGVGINKEDLSRLFQKFGRLDNSYVAAATSGGTGLGLYISKSLIDLMGGKIWATSEGLGKGTTFIFSLPAATPQVLKDAEKFVKKPVGEAKALEPVAI